MFLVKEKIVENRFKKNSTKVYVNTLVPHFQFKNNKGDIIKPTNFCINL